MSLDFSISNPQRNPLFLHPVLLEVVEQIIDQTEQSLGAGFTVKMISTLRTPAEQFVLFQQGRSKPGKPVTNVDGFHKKSNHNYQPAQAVDFGIFRGGKYMTEGHFYEHLAAPTRKAEMTWGGDWKSFKDRPHIEIPRKFLFKESRIKGSAIVWQTYLRMAGTYHGKMDGDFGPISRAALRQVVGTDERNRTTYEFLFRKFGMLTPQDLLHQTLQRAA